MTINDLSILIFNINKFFLNKINEFNRMIPSMVNVNYDKLFTNL